MRLRRFYFPGSLNSNGHICLPQALSNRLRHVLRVKKGDVICLFNGLGGESKVVIEAISNPVVVHVIAFDPNDRVPNRDVHLVVALSQGKTMDWVMQKATELGVKSIQPIITMRSKVSQVSPSTYERWRKIVVSACEQCGLNRLPEILPCLTFQTWLEQSGHCPFVVPNPHGDDAPIIFDGLPDEIRLLIGCEGGWSPEELLQMEGLSNMKYWYMGERILRMETAVVVACSWLTCLV